MDILGLPSECGGALVTGTQMADLTALAEARHALLSRHDWDIEGDGLFGAPPISLLVGEEVHATMLKALSLIGFGRNRVHKPNTRLQDTTNEVLDHFKKTVPMAVTWQSS
jgi:glutamate/tyrosine decarboxylase-like PLP-dependent enzyme